MIVTMLETIKRLLLGLYKLLDLATLNGESNESKVRKDV